MSIAEVAVRRLSVLLGVLAALALGAGAAAAEPPVRVDDRVTDRAGVLGAGGAEVSAAVERLRAESGVDLFVVFVDSFDGADGQDWADETAVRSQLGAEDALLAVAVRDRAYGLSVDDGFPVSESRVDDVRTEDVEPRLAAGDWTGAAVAMADGLRSGGGDGTGLLLLAGGVAVVGGGAYLLRRRRRARSAGPRASDARDVAPGEPIEDLAFRASAALIEVDDAVRTSEQELAAARAHFGDEAVAPFAAALERARADMLRAFALRQQLDDDQPEDERAQRALHAEIIELATAADERLDDQVEAFDALRGLEARAPRYVAELRTRLDGVADRLPQAEEVWAALQVRYAAGALEPVDGDLAQARELLAAADAELVEAERELAATGSAAGATSAEGGRAQGGAPVSARPTPSRPEPDGADGEPSSPTAAAVVAGRAAEDAIGQAEALIDGVLRRETELADAAERIPAARAEVELDLAEARALPGEEIAPVVARAAAALTAAAEAVAGPRPDPLAALRLLGEAGAALDAGVADARAAADRARRAAAALEQAVLSARASVSAAEDFVATRRGAVGAGARTRIAEARRHLQLAGGSDPVAALREAQQADALAREALAAARADVARWNRPTVSTGAGADLGSLVLGGILQGAARSYRSGGRRHRSGGGFSSGGFGGSSRRGSRGGGGRF